MHLPSAKNRVLPQYRSYVPLMSDRRWVGCRGERSKGRQWKSSLRQLRSEIHERKDASSVRQKQGSAPVPSWCSVNVRAEMGGVPGQAEQGAATKVISPSTLVDNSWEERCISSVRQKQGFAPTRYRSDVPLMSDWRWVGCWGEWSEGRQWKSSLR